MQIGKEYVMNAARHPTIRRVDLIVFLPPLAATAYPFLLMLFHQLVGPLGSQPAAINIISAAIVLMFAFSAPVLGIAVACRPFIDTNFRRLAYASIVAPTLYVFLGVVQALIDSPIPDQWIWCAIWLGTVLLALRLTGNRTHSNLAPVLGKWRVAHGISAVVVCTYVIFHLGNHLVGLIGPSEHGAVMDFGRSVYRAKFIEPVLILAFIFQIFSGLYLAWRWSTARHGFFHAFQVGSGVYLSVFILGHMNSVFIYARTYLSIPTDWDFAIGAPTGLIHDPWNIRLLPHYALGVFFVLSHLVAGLRVVLNAHGADTNIADRVWFIGVAASAAIAVAIIAGMCGVRI